MHFGVGQMVEGTQQHAAPGMKSDSAADVRMPDDEFGDRADFRLRGREGTGAELLEFLTPIAWEISI